MDDLPNQTDAPGETLSAPADNALLRRIEKRGNRHSQAEGEFDLVIRAGDVFDTRFDRGVRALEDSNEKGFFLAQRADGKIAMLHVELVETNSGGDSAMRLDDEPTRLSQPVEAQAAEAAPPAEAIGDSMADPLPTRSVPPRTDYTIERVWYEMYTAQEHDSKGRPCHVLRACVDVGYPGTASSPRTHDSWRLIAPGLSEKEIRRQAHDELLDLGLNLRSVLPAKHRRRMLKLAKTAELQYRGKFHFDAF